MADYILRVPILDMSSIYVNGAARHSSPGLMFTSHPATFSAPVSSPPQTATPSAPTLHHPQVLRFSQPPAGASNVVAAHKAAGEAVQVAAVNAHEPAQLSPDAVPVASPWICP